jgi:predicted phage terminase large subunit-like protein
LTEDVLKEFERNSKAGFPQLRIPKEKTPMELFVETYLSHYLRYQTPDFHREIAWMLQNRDIYPLILLTAPRYFAKSVWAILFDTLYDICIRSNPDFHKFKNVYDANLTESCFGCETAIKSRKWMRVIRREITTNKLILRDFGDLSTEDIRGEQWNQDVLTFQTGFTLYGFGCQKGRGEHPRKLTLDDIESKETARSKDQCDNIEEWIKGTLFPMFEDVVPRITWIGTILRAGCVIDNAYEGKGWDASWYRRKYDCYDEKGQSIWPDRWPVEKLKARERQMGSIMFGQEYRNKSYGSINPVYRKHHIKYYKESELPKNLYTVMSVDPAISEKRSADEASICVTSLCLEGQRKMDVFVRDIDHGRWGPEGILNRMFAFYLAYRPQLVMFEINAFQGVLKLDFENQALDRGLYPDVRGISHNLDKWIRATNVVGIFEMGKVYFLPDHPQQTDLINQLINFPSVAHDDMHDSLEMCLAHLKSYIYMLKQDEKETPEEEAVFVGSEGLRKLGWVA